MGLERTPLTKNNKGFVICTIKGQEIQITLTKDEHQQLLTIPKEEQQAYLEALHAKNLQEIEQETLNKQTMTPTPKFTSTPSERKESPNYERGARSSFARPTTPGAKSPVSTENSEDQEINDIRDRTTKIEENMKSQKDEIQKDRNKLYENVEDWDYTEDEETQEKIGLSIILEENSSSRNEKYKRKVCNGFALKIDKKI